MAQIDPPAELDMLVQATVDVERARRETRDMAVGVGFDVADSEMVVLAVSELATNLARYAPGGRIRVRSIVEPVGVGLEVQSHDAGPGIPDPEQAVQGGASSSGGLGLGLAGVRRLMDEFEISSVPGGGTTVVCRKWLRRR